MIDFKSLRVWEAFHNITLKIYEISQSFPDDEKYGLILQVRRSSSSVPTNIAEGCGRYSDSELQRFLIIAMGSASELEYQLILAKDLGYLSIKTYERLNEELVTAKKMLNVFIYKIKKRLPKNTKP